MYKLYSNNNVRTMIDASENEQDIIDTIGDYLKTDINSRFIVIYSQKRGDCIHAIINKPEDYVEYLKNYKEKLKNMSCVELKKEIVYRDLKKR